MKNKIIKEWYSFTSKTDIDVTDIDIFDEIGDNFFTEGVTIKSFVSKLKKVKTGKINIRINSNGGDVFHGLSIFNAIKEYEGYTTVTILGVAASIASVIAMAGDKVIIPKNAFIMIHDPSSGVFGNSEDMVKMADTLNKVKKSLISAYQDKTGLPEDELSELMAEETWLTAQESIDKGFADEMTSHVPMQACAGMDKYNFKNMPQQFKNIKINNNNKTRKEIIMDLNDFKADHAELYKEVFGLGVKSCEIDAVANVQFATDAERARIKSVEDQLIPGHADLIENLKWDGKTTGEQAAMAVLHAEKKMRANMQDDLNSDTVEAVIVDALVVEDVEEKDFMAIVMDYAKTTDCSHGSAISHVARINPAAHAKWITGINKGGK